LIHHSSFIYKNTGSVALISFERSSTIIAGDLAANKNRTVLWQTVFSAISDYLALLDHVHQCDSTQSTTD
jgi:hypothetical protein